MENEDGGERRGRGEGRKGRRIEVVWRMKKVYE